MPAPRRPMRLQFSLRMLLLFMAAIGSGLAIFRWPWEVTVVDTVATRTTGYRRGWNGKAVQHGSDRLVITRTEQATWEKQYVDGELVRERTYQPPGMLREEKHLGPAPGETRTRRFEDLGGEKLVIETSSRPGDQFTYHVQWKTPAGQLLESVERVDGRIITWNGQPFESAMANILASLADWREREEWLAPRTSNGANSVDQLGDATFRFRAYSQGRRSEYDLANQQLVSLHFGNAGEQQLSDIEVFFLHSTLMHMGSRMKNPSVATLSEQLLREMHRTEYTLRPRFGILCCVPITLASLRGDDPTGISRIQFDRSSPQYSDWIRLTFPMRQKFASHAERLQDFFADTSLVADLTHITHVEPRPLPDAVEERIDLQLAFPFDSSHLRPRRDIFGLFLSHNNYRVEQQGNKLIVLPRTKGS